MNTPRAISILISALTLCATAAAHGADELGAPAGAAFGQAVGAQNLAVLHDNGNWITGVGNGAGGADTSVVELNFNTYGYSLQQSLPNRVADDFGVPGGVTWNLTSATWRAYQTGSSTSGAITGATVRLWNGPPGVGSVVAGDTTTNRLTGQVWSGVYRVASSALNSAARPVMDVAIDLSWLPPLSAGTYWLDVGMSGSLAGGPFANPTVPRDSGDNAREFDSTAMQWDLVIDSTSGLGQDFPFDLDGTTSGCAAPTSYCTPKLSSNNCLAQIGSSNLPSISAGNFTVNATQVESLEPGILIYSLSGPNGQPFQGGFLCVQPPIFRLPLQNTGGGPSNTCTGTPSRNVTNVLTIAGAGSPVSFQWWFRDSGDFFGSGLSNGLSVVVCP